MAQTFDGALRGLLGEDHALTSRGNVASFRGEAGDAAGAAEEFADLVEHMVRVLGEDHPHTLTVRGNVARWRGETGDAAGAARAYADLLERMVRVLGDDHGYTLLAGSNLAYGGHGREIRPEPRRRTPTFRNAWRG